MEIKLDIPKGYKPEITEQEDGYLLRFFEPKEEPKFKQGEIINGRLVYRKIGLWEMLYTALTR